MKRHRLLFVTLCFSIFSFSIVSAKDQVVADSVALKQGTTDKASLRERALAYIKETYPAQWVAWALNQHEKKGDTRIILVKNDMQAFIDSDPDLQCIDPRVIVAYKTTNPDNQFKPIIIGKGTKICPFRFRQAGRPFAVSGEWKVHPSRKTADISGLMTQALEELLSTDKSSGIYFNGFCLAHGVPCVNYGLKNRVIDPLFD